MPSNRDRNRAGVTVRLTDRDYQELREEVRKANKGSIGELLDQLLEENEWVGERRKIRAHHFEVSRGLWERYLVPVPRGLRAGWLRWLLMGWLERQRIPDRSPAGPIYWEE